MRSSAPQRVMQLPATAATPASPAGAPAAPEQTAPAAQPGGAPIVSSTEQPGGAENAAPAQGGAPNDAGAAKDAAAGQAPGSATPQAQGIPADQGLKALEAEFGEEFLPPVVAADGSVYMQRRKPKVGADGKIAIGFVLVAKIDAAKNLMVINPEFIQAQQPKRDPKGKPVQIEGRWFWQTLVPGEDGKLASKLDPLSEDEVQRLGAALKQQEEQQKAQAWDQDKAEWSNRLNRVALPMKTIGYTGSFLNALAAGPDPITGKTQANWLSGYMALQMLDAQSEGKIIPKFMKSGAFGTALDLGTNVYMMLDMGNDIKTLGTAFPALASAMRGFTSPTRAIIDGAKGGAAAGAGAAMQEAGGAMAKAAVDASQQIDPVATAINAAKTPVQREIARLGGDIATGAVKLVGAKDMAGMSAVVTSQNGVQAVHLVPKGMVQEGARMVAKAGESSLSGPMKLQNGIKDAIHGTVKQLSPGIRTLMLGGSILGTVASGINLQRVIKHNGGKALLNTSQGRSALFGFLTSASMLGMSLLPMVGGPLGSIAVGGTTALSAAMSGLNVASNVFSGVSFLNQAGLFGDGGWMDHDAARAAFLVPPLTPIGLWAMRMKKKKKEAEKVAAEQQARQAEAAKQVVTVRDQALAVLQQTGTLPGGKQGPGGEILISTGVSADAATGGAASGSESKAGTSAPGPSASEQRTLQLLARPVR